MQEHSFRQYELHRQNGTTQPSGRRAVVPTAARSPLAGTHNFAFLGTAILFAFLLTVLWATAAKAQDQRILMPGDAVVTGFAGIKAPDAPIAPGTDPLDMFHIDLDGPSAQVFQLGAAGAPARGQIIQANAPFKLRARDAGQVFAIALDDALPPNIYVGQTAAFGLNIVGADANGDGRPDRLKKGQPDARWMAGQFGTDKGGGPGSIYRIDGRTGAVSLFATIPGTSGAGLGAIVFDRTTRQFLVSDLDNGLIHRLDANGAVMDSFDHGTAGRTATGLDPIADDGRQIDIKSSAFDVEEPDTWGFTQPERRVSGMAILLGRLYYAVADEIWSIGIGADGRLAGDARLEVQVANAPIDSAITKIAFDGEGRMYLAQRGAQRGSYDYSVFAEPLRSSVLRYQRDPASPSDWAPMAEQYAIGLPPDFRNGSGGVALGYGHDESGSIRRGACNRTLWSTGDNLRNSPSYASQLNDEGPLDVHGLQGNDVSLVRPKNEPPLNSYFVDYDGQFGDSEKAGHVGDVEIWQPCHSSYGLGQLTPGYWPDGEWPGFWLPPTGTLATNLRLEKKAITCWPIGGGKHRCGFSIKVINTGPGLYHDHIQVRDMIPAGTTATFSSPKFDACPGGPPNHTCTTLAPVHLLPWEQVTIPVRVDVPDNLAKQLDCKVKNRALILHAPSPSEQNTDPSDDDDTATAHLPAHLCKDPPKEKNNLRITKQPLSCFKTVGNKIRCGYHVRVWNMGPGDYNDTITVSETIPAGATPIFSGPAPLGWNCVGGNPYACNSNPVSLSPGQNALLVVRLDITQAQAKAMGCKVRNTASITHAPGGSDHNTNPGDDSAVAIANVPANLCDPPAEKTNLKITKLPLGCFKIAGNKIRCGYHIRVRNTGPGDYNDNIKFTDQVPPGTTATFSSAKFDACPGGPPTYTCTTTAPVSLNSGQSVLVVARVDMPVNVAKQMDCKVRNRVHITYAPIGNKNTDASDEHASVVATVPAEICDQQQPANLKVTKVANPQLCTKVAQGWRCGYDITVENTGPGVYQDRIELKETLPAEPVTASWNLGWNCQGTGGAGAICKSLVNLTLQPTQHVVLKLNVTFSDADVIQRNCRLPNIVEITHVAGGFENTNPADDKAGAVAFVPEEFCNSTTNLKVEKTTFVEGDCPLVGNATWCKRFRIAVWNAGPGTFNGQIKVVDIPSPGLNIGFDGLGKWTCNAATRICQTDGVLNPGANDASIPVFVVNVSGDDNDAKALNCKLKNVAQLLTPWGAPHDSQVGDNQSEASYDLPARLCRPEPASQVCPAGFRWTGDRCSRGPGLVTLPGCPDGQWLNKGHCCPVGQIWTGRRCGEPPRKECPEGTTGKWPNCREVEEPKCPEGTTGRWPNCRKVDEPKQCPEGTTGKWPNCRKVEEPKKCPEGTTGKWPNCRKVEEPKKCPEGTTGKWPNCKRPEPPKCPKGMTGTPPNCKRIVPEKCPTGMVGKPPNCRKPPTQTPPTLKRQANAKPKLARR